MTLKTQLSLDDVLLKLSERFSSRSVIPPESVPLTRNEGAVLMTGIAELRKAAIYRTVAECENEEPYIPPADAEALARLFHRVYERLAPYYGYKRRKFDPCSRRGRLMLRVCAELIARDLAYRAGVAASGLDESLKPAKPDINTGLDCIAESAKQGPYTLVTDDSGHWYVIPVARQSEWNRWADGSEHSLGVIPDYAQSVGGSPSLVQFTGYKIE